MSLMCGLSSVMIVNEFDVVPYLYESSRHVPVIVFPDFFSEPDSGLRKATKVSADTISSIAVARITIDFFIDIYFFGLFKCFLLNIYLSILHNKCKTILLVLQIF